MAHLLGAEALHLEYPTKAVFDSITLGIEEGDRIGIVGRNGDGKSSLLAMLTGRKEPDARRVTARAGTTIGVLDQADTLDDALTITQSAVGDAPEYEWAGDARVRDVIQGLLADLDVEAITWFAGHLKKRGAANAGAFLVVMHDRWFLDEIEQYWNDPVRKVIEGLRTEYTFGTGSKAQALTPGQLNVLILDGPNNREPSIEKLTTLSHRRSRSSGTCCHVRRRGYTPRFSLRARAVVR